MGQFITFLLASFSTLFAWGFLDPLACGPYLEQKQYSPDYEFVDEAMECGYVVFGNKYSEVDRREILESIVMELERLSKETRELVPNLVFFREFQDTLAVETSVFLQTPENPVLEVFRRKLRRNPWLEENNLWHDVLHEFESLEAEVFRLKRELAGGILPRRKQRHYMEALKVRLQRRVQFERLVERIFDRNGKGSDSLAMADRCLQPLPGIVWHERSLQLHIESMQFECEVGQCESGGDLPDDRGRLWLTLVAPSFEPIKAVQVQVRDGSMFRNLGNSMTLTKVRRSGGHFKARLLVLKMDGEVPSQLQQALYNPDLSFRVVIERVDKSYENLELTLAPGA